MTVVVAPTGETRVNTTRSKDERNTSVDCLSDGGWIVAWTSSDNAVYHQRYASNGLPIGGETLVSSKPGFQAEPCVTAMSNGGWLITWTAQGYDGSSTAIVQQRYSASGIEIGSETIVNTFTEGSQTSSSVASLSKGGWVVTWTAPWQDGSGQAVYQQRYNSAGIAEGGEIRVNTYTTQSQSFPSVTALVDGGWVVTWQSEDQDGSVDGVYQQRYGANGQRIEGEKQVHSSTTGYQNQPVTAALADGGWIVTWQSSSLDGSQTIIYQQRFDAGGAAVGGETQVNTLPRNGGELQPTVTSLADGGWIVTWQSINSNDAIHSIHQQRYSANGQAVGAEMLVKSQVYYDADDYRGVSVTALDDGGWIVTWEGETPGLGFDVYQQRFTAMGERIGPTTPTGLSSALLFQEGQTGASGQLTVKAFDVSQGHTYTLLDDAGGRFALTANGTLIVKDGLKLDHEQAQSHQIRVQVKDGPGATYEQWVQISVADVASENLTGSAAADVLKGGGLKDIFKGSGGNDALYGGAGHDWLHGGLGNDMLSGQAGKDVFVFDTKLNKRSNVDKISDFRYQDDSLYLENKIFTKLGSGSATKPKKFKADMFTTGTKAKDAEDRIVYDKKTGSLYYDQDGTGSKAQVKIATLTNKAVLKYSDFFVI